ncbi:hypothetical protein E2C01_001925 [Portunus trituberculatus]|uniref:Uncharacterized protein n=1 Tax=Portunus trituberculatus TaxID=210409 RepID=A0A5B7CIG4_PORTR|nr:hypothetical protein [Portunus trituberculatus]
MDVTEQHRTTQTFSATLSYPRPALSSSITAGEETMFTSTLPTSGHREKYQGSSGSIGSICGCNKFQGVPDKTTPPTWQR